MGIKKSETFDTVRGNVFQFPVSYILYSFALNKCWLLFTSISKSSIYTITILVFWKTTFLIFSMFTKRIFYIYTWFRDAREK